MEENSEIVIRLDLITEYLHKLLQVNLEIRDVLGKFNEALDDDE